MALRKLLWLLSFLSFIIYATAATEIGAALPGIVSEFKLSESLIGVLASLQSLAGILAILGGVLSDFFGKMRLVSLSLLIMGVGALLISGSPAAPLLGASLFIFGSGMGFFEASVNACISEIFRERRGMAINLLHIGWNIGSSIGPPLAAYAILAYGSWRIGYLLVSPFLLALSLASWASARASALPSGGGNRSSKAGIASGSVLTLLPLMIIPFFLVANQLGITAWLPSILVDQGAPLMEASLAVGLFWALSGVGRLSWALFTDRIGYWRILLLAGSSSAILMLLTLLPLPIHAKIALWSCSGFFLGPAYPTVVAWVTSIRPEIGGTLSGILFASATLGSFASTVATGLLFDLFGSRIAQLIFPLLIIPVAAASYIMRGIGGSGESATPR